MHIFADILDAPAAKFRRSTGLPLKWSRVLLPPPKELLENYDRQSPADYATTPPCMALYTLPNGQHVAVNWGTAFSHDPNRPYQIVLYSHNCGRIHDVVNEATYEQTVELLEACIKKIEEPIYGLHDFLKDIE